MNEAVGAAEGLLRVRGIGLRVRDTVARVRESRPAAPVGEPEVPADDPSGADLRRVERRGWAGVAAITGIVALTWIPLLGMPFGDNHLGRIIGRYALQLRNLQEQGILGSHFGADWLPYASTPYAHHPPLFNLLTALTGLLPSDGEHQVWLPAYLLALLIIPAGAALLRGLGLRWSATLLALGLMVATPFYWVYSPLMFDLGPILALSALVVRLRARPDPSRRLVAGACVAALLTTLVSWPGVGFAAVLGLWLLAARRVDRVTVLVGASMLAGVAISLAFVVGVTGMNVLGGQAELRSTGGGYTVRQFLRRQWQYAYDLLPLWYIGALPIGAVVGLLDRRTRVYLAMAVAFTGAWILGLSNGAFVHSYWSYPMLVVGLVGMGVLLDRLAARLTGRTGDRLDGLDVSGRGNGFGAYARGDARDVSRGDGRDVSRGDALDVSRAGGLDVSRAGGLDVSRAGGLDVSRAGGLDVSGRGDGLDVYTRKGEFGGHPEDGGDLRPMGERIAGMPAAVRRFVRTRRWLAGRRVRVTAAALVGTALGAYLGVLVLGPDRQRLLDEPAQAGRLVAGHPPPAGQRYAWVAGTGATSARWLAYYWRLKPRLLTATTLHTEPTRPEDLVLVNLHKRPDWLPESVEARAVARDGPYALFPVAVLISAADS
ncbi:ArnT family glycosyltransferase [Plantactinospora sp. CA-294935]|uniref:ArnT family glycosyltransferase n=1 Tax=Plantactinospora sp. CA-294935 TaxID=3240012 RepID=UPI003D8D6011